MQTTCEVCHGKGTIASSQCHQCGGSKIEIGEDVLVISIERGMPDGYQIRFPQAADETPDTIPGDITFTVITSPHPRFRREGNDLYYTLQISLLEALVGFDKTIEHLDGHHVPVKRNRITVPGMLIVSFFKFMFFFGCFLLMINFFQAMLVELIMKACLNMNILHNVGICLSLTKLFSLSL
jgi:DnaJ-class molecular chaperone